MLTEEQVGKLEVNKQYQEAVKLAITLLTASLVLPTVFLTNILGLNPEELETQLRYPEHRSAACAWVAWLFLFASLVCCWGFYHFSTKFTKALYGLYKDKKNKDIIDETKLPSMEAWRDNLGKFAFVLAVVGIVLVFVFARIVYSNTALTDPPAHLNHLFR